ncbi:hypothetical protein Trydic_g11472 [Trypoxylus dichotomus]
MLETNILKRSSISKLADASAMGERLLAGARNEVIPPTDGIAATNAGKQVGMSTARIVLPMVHMEPDSLFMFSKEATFPLSGRVNKHNYIIWTTERPMEVRVHMRDSPSKTAPLTDYSLMVRDYLNDKFGKRWIDRGGPLLWGARLPDMTPDHAPRPKIPRGMVEDRVYSSKPRNLDDLKHRNTHVIAKIPAQMPSRVLQTTMDRPHKCIESDRYQIETL